MTAVDPPYNYNIFWQNADYTENNDHGVIKS